MIYTRTNSRVAVGPLIISMPVTPTQVFQTSALQLTSRTRQKKHRVWWITICSWRYDFNICKSATFCWQAALHCCVNHFPLITCSQHFLAWFLTLSILTDLLDTCRSNDSYSQQTKLRNSSSDTSGADEGDPPKGSVIMMGFHTLTDWSQGVRRGGEEEGAVKYGFTDTVCSTCHGSLRWSVILTLLLCLKTIYSNNCKRHFVIKALYVTVYR